MQVSFPTFIFHANFIFTSNYFHLGLLDWSQIQKGPFRVLEIVKQEEFIMWRQTKQNFLCIIVVVLVILIGNLAWAEMGNDKTLSPYFFIQDGEPSVDRFPLKETDVRVKVNGVIADVVVTQVYGNEGTRPIHARYVFPASTRASVHGMKMTVGEEVVTARIRERQEARKEFEKAKREGRSTSLLEQQRPNVFTMNLGNILPKDEVKIELHYTELLIPTEGTYSFVYPTVVGPRYSSQKEADAPQSDHWVKSPYMKEGSLPPARFRMNVSLSTGIPLQELFSPSHRLDVSWESPSLADVSLSDSKEFGGNRDFILHYRLAGEETQCGLMLYEGEQENFFLLMMQPPHQLKTNDILPREYVFILDVSGSMNGFPLATAKVLIKDLISHLRETDRFNVVLFAGASSLMAASSVASTQENIRTALHLIDAQQGGGGTELSAALRKALALPRDESYSRTLVIITDGYIAAEKEAFDLIHDHIHQTNVFSFGIGTGVNRYLVEGLAKAGIGEPFVVTRPEEARESAERFRNYIQSPVLSQVKVKIREFEAYEQEPPALPDLFAERPLIFFGKWRGERKGEIEISGRSGAGDFVQRFPIAETKPLPIHQALRYLWAREKVARLSDFHFGRQPAENKDQVISLGLTYSLLTPFTSFVAVLEKVRNETGMADSVDQPLPLPKHVSNLAVGGGCSQVPEPGLVLLAGAAALASGIATLVRRRRT
jgi:Ca-activated chloride channel family protein